MEARTMSYQNKRDTQITETPLTEPEIEAMLRGFIRNDRLFSEALRAGLTADHFAVNPSELRFYALVGSMIALREKHGQLTKAMLVHYIAGLVVNNLVALSSAELTALIGDTDTNTTGLIEDAFDAPVLSDEKEKAERSYAESILKRFLNSRLIKQSLQSALNRAHGDTSPVDIDKLLDSFCQKSQRVRHVGASVENAAAMPKFNDMTITLPPPPDPTNIPWIDSYIGGIRPGDLLGVLAPFGGGKTTMLISAAVRIAENYHLTNQNKLAVFVGFEDGADKTKHLCWSAAAHIERKLFSLHETTKFWLQFSSAAAGNLKPYEFELPENQNGKVLLGEQERWEASDEWYNKNFVYLDFAHTGGHNALGSGGPVELSETLHKLAEDRKAEIGFIAIDYAGLMIERMAASESMMLNAKVQESMWRYIKTLPDQLRRHVADEFNATVLIAHQLAPGDIRTYKPNRYVHHHDSQGGKSFAENLHACFCMGMRDLSTKAATIYWSKIRAYMPPSQVGIIKIHDHYVGVDLVTDKYRVCNSTKRIVDKKDAFGGAVGGIVAPPTKAKDKDIDDFTNNLM
jgi:hypothetical protein